MSTYTSLLQQERAQRDRLIRQSWDALRMQHPDYSSVSLYRILADRFDLETRRIRQIVQGHR